MLKMSILYILYFSNGEHAMYDTKVFVKDAKECHELGNITATMSKKMLKHPEYLRSWEIVCTNPVEVRIPVPMARPLH